ncbi:mfs [Moniliophthora roreri MCA 2997]|uniref:Mfs n=1 Tax=Moniliophthora roreri (strain MCA 2997) TaxID=1381753 RepID=V2XAH3_MONRO|nr:mfs [Moniliophthora roreri MCA 2997]
MLRITRSSSIKGPLASRDCCHRGSMAEKSGVDEKAGIEETEHPTGTMEDTSVREKVSEEDNRRILRKTDLNLLTILTWVYWLQILDKTVLGYAATFGLREDANLHGNQYSIIGSMNAIAQLAWQPFSSYLLVRIKPRYFMPTIVFCWGVAMCGMAASTDYAGLVASRFLLGLFEAACLPLFAILTSVWYRRVEQPLRVAIWYGTNGLGTIMASIFAYGFGQIRNPALHVYQIIFLFCGLLTCVTAPFIYWKLDNSVSEARFLTPKERKKAVERLRANNTGTKATDTFKWEQALEALFELKIWLFFAMTLLLNVGASVTNVFGPLVLAGIGFDKFTTSLLNIPFGAMQILVIGFSSYVSYHWKTKSFVLMALVIPVIIGLALLYVHSFSTGVLLFAYYLLAFLFGGNPLIISWMTANIAGSTKKSVSISGYNAASACGNIIGPYLFASTDAPLYKHGLRSVLGIFVALFVVVVLQVIHLMILNKLKARQRVKNGKPAVLHDFSMDKKFNADAKIITKAGEEGEREIYLGDNAFKDLYGQAE